MYIEKLIINNFKCYEGEFSLDFNSGLNILVGDNEAWKSTILEAIHLALTWWIAGRYLRNELDQSLFNNETIIKYIRSLNTANKLPPPAISIELFISWWEDNAQGAHFQWSFNSDKRLESTWILFEIKFSDKFSDEYQALLESNNITSLPIEYYDMQWTSFARDRQVTPKTIPLKSAFIDSSGNRFKNGSDIYISRIIQDNLSEKQKIDISQAHRKMRDSFSNDPSVILVNKSLIKSTDVSEKKITLSVDVSTKTAWETSLLTYLDDVPFHNVGKWEQCLIKTKLAISHRKSQEASVLLIEEPENHLSHTGLNKFVAYIKSIDWSKQTIISTHSSFIANKLSIWGLLLLNRDINTKKRNIIKFSDLTDDTQEFFEKLPWYDTLRVLLCKKAVLVEGPSDELIFQRAYLDNQTAYPDKKRALPIEKWIEIISVGTTFLRFLEIAEKLHKPVAVITDNDGNYSFTIESKYKNYLSSEFVKIFADSNNSLNTLEPQIIEANKLSLPNLRTVLGITEIKYPDQSSLNLYMQNNKTECALKIYSNDIPIKYPDYILQAVNWADEK
jgi:putative ATP-dependent endonuclease of the OLD family